ncbi:MAG TPA: SMC-Scp complex subunit ScpB [Longimicrobiales bacterium]
MRTTEIIEALLFASDAPLSAADLSRAAEGLDEDAVEQAILALRAEYDATGRAFQIYELAGGYQLLTRPEYAGVLERFHTVPQSGRLSGPALEVLAIIAYRQPIGRAEIEEIRGIGSAGVLRTLQERQLVDVVGRGEGLGRPLLYGTTQKFLEHFGFNSLHDLPRPDELPVVLKQRAPDAAAAVQEAPPGAPEAAPSASEAAPAAADAEPGAAAAAGAPAASNGAEPPGAGDERPAAPDGAESAEAEDAPAARAGAEAAEPAAEERETTPEGLEPAATQQREAPPESPELLVGEEGESGADGPEPVVAEEYESAPDVAEPVAAEQSDSGPESPEPVVAEERHSAPDGPGQVIPEERESTLDGPEQVIAEQRGSAPESPGPATVQEEATVSVCGESPSAGEPPGGQDGAGLAGAEDRPAAAQAGDPES